MRVFELARDLGLTSRDLLTSLEKMGFAVEDHASQLDDESIKKVRQKLGKATTTKKTRKKPVATPKPEPVETAPAAPKARVVVKRRRAEKPAPEASPTSAKATENQSSAEASPAPAPKTPPVQKPVSTETPAATPPGLTPHLGDTALAEAKKKKRVVIDLEPKVKKPAPKAAETEPAAEATTPEPPLKKTPPTSLPSAGDRVRAAKTHGLSTPEGLTPHLGPSGDTTKERVIIDLPKAAPAAPGRGAKPERKERKKGREMDAPKAPAPAPGAVDKRKWQSFKGKKGKGRSRDETRFELARPRKDVSEGSLPRVRAIRIQEGNTVKEFADALGVKVNVIIAELMKMGAMATLNDPIDLDAAQLIATDMDVNMEVVMDKTEEELLQVVEDSAESLVPRAPVVTIMGHVDHGKTSLLDAIRDSRVTAREAGGITQHIGAYAVETERGKVVFLDTPGHAAFTSMRARGAQATDIVVLVVAGDDGVMPQTIEAIHHAKEAGVPIIVAITKMDRPGVNPDKVMQGLSEHELVPESWGGDTMFQNVSAHTKEGLDELLEKILLQAEVMELKANPDKPAVGIVVEARLDRGRGPVATVLIQGGTLKAGDFFVTGNHTGRVRAMNDDLGTRLEEAPPSTPVEIIGLEGVPSAGDSFQAVTNERAAKEVADTRRQAERSRILAREKKMSLTDLFDQMKEDEVVELPLLLRGDVQGSVEAIQDGLEKLSTDKVKVKVLHTGVGGITETDVMLAAASNAIIMGFSVRPEPKAAKLAEQEGVDIRLYSVIYNLMDDVKAAMEGLLSPEYKEVHLGRAEVREVFQVPRAGMVAGCSVVDGVIQRNCAGLRVVRDNVVIHEGPLSALRRFKDDVKEVATGYECGISFERFNDIKVGDVIEAFAIEEIAAKL
ncbi:MAG: translation initiation factor IF-2 [Leptospirillia bacterium]